LSKLFVAFSRNHVTIDIDDFEKESFVNWMKTDIKNLNQCNYINGILSVKRPNGVI